MLQGHLIIEMKLRILSATCNVVVGDQRNLASRLRLRQSQVRLDEVLLNIG